MPRACPTSGPGPSRYPEAVTGIDLVRAGQLIVAAGGSAALDPVRPDAAGPRDRAPRVCRRPRGLRSAASRALLLIVNRTARASGSTRASSKAVRFRFITIHSRKTDCLSPNRARSGRDRPRVPLFATISNARHPHQRAVPDSAARTPGRSLGNIHTRSHRRSRTSIS